MLCKEWTLVALYLLSLDDFNIFFDDNLFGKFYLALNFLPFHASHVTVDHVIAAEY